MDDEVHAALNEVFSPRRFALAIGAALVVADIAGDGLAILGAILFGYFLPAPRKRTYEKK